MIRLEFNRKTSLACRWKSKDFDFQNFCHATQSKVREHFVGPVFKKTANHFPLWKPVGSSSCILIVSLRCVGAWKMFIWRLDSWEEENMPPLGQLLLPSLFNKKSRNLRPETYNLTAVTREVGKRRYTFFLWKMCLLFWVVMWTCTPS